jgi:hypothetical protein
MWKRTMSGLCGSLRSVSSAGTDDGKVGSPACISSVLLDIVQPAGDEVAISPFRPVGRVYEPIKQVGHRSREGEQCVHLLRCEAERCELEGVLQRFPEEREQAARPINALTNSAKAEGKLIRDEGRLT